MLVFKFAKASEFGEDMQNVADMFVVYDFLIELGDKANVQFLLNDLREYHLQEGGVGFQFC